MLACPYSRLPMICDIDPSEQDGQPDPRPEADFSHDQDGKADT